MLVTWSLVWYLGTFIRSRFYSTTTCTRFVRTSITRKEQEQNYV